MSSSTYPRVLTLPPPLILESLASAGVSGALYNWFMDLKNRRQRVVLDGVSSPSQEVSSGVP